jgi:hypothetical protein
MQPKSGCHAVRGLFQLAASPEFAPGSCLALKSGEISGGCLRDIRARGNGFVTKRERREEVVRAFHVVLRG